MASTTNPRLFVLQTIIFVVLFSVIGSLTFTVWNQSREIQNVRQEMYNEINKLNIKTDDTSILAVAKTLHRNRRDASQTSINILANAITEIIEKKLYTILECSQNTTECTLKPGPKGEKGINGEQGKDGLQGVRGDPGMKGIIGNKGATGRPGPTGVVGPKGDTGNKGEKGQLGYPGYKGDTGPQGPSGIQGPRGDTGAGLKGDMGPIGPQGAPGETGQQGRPGTSGNKGDKGEQGVIGLRGPTGLTGLKGVNGEIGFPGRKGEKGQVGLQGPPGPKGQPGSLADTIRLGTLSNPVASCSILYNNNYQSNNYWVTNAANQPVNVYCDMDRECCNNGVRGWMKVADIDMTNSNQQCPNGFTLHTRTSAPRRTCGRPGGGCSSTIFPANGVRYSRVCGRIVAYQLGSPSAFAFLSTSNPINGIVLTHSQSQQHIWSFANGAGETYGNTEERCPCSGGSASASSIGSDYFCDSAVRGSSVSNGRWYTDDPLWDGAGCGSTSTCCQLNNPPWFCKQLPQATTEDIELRLCENSPPNTDDSPFEIVEIYVN